ncbi:MAG TPA: glycosyltransferase family 39 protein, partial [Gammaproteobacteria bacterium]|nr:glycosyltransferase family 39 protein [Gammaproteobacteria bacterium]
MDFSDSGTVARRILILLGLFLALYALNLILPRDLWVQDEARYGEVVREMISTGQWLVPHLNAHPYPDKPAPYFWIVAAVGALVGQGALAFRIVTVLSTLAAAAGVYAFAGRLGTPRYAVRACAAFLTLTLTLLVGQIARMDMLLTACVVFSLYALVRHRDEGGGRWLFAFWLFVALGVATKGPIALLFSALPALIWRGWVDGWAGLRSLRPVAGLLALMAMVGAWILSVWAIGYGHYLSVIWNEQLVGRAVDSWSHREPVYFYLLVAPLVFMPWTPLIVRGLYRLLSSRETWRGRVATDALLIVVIAVPFIAISMVSGKLFIYMQPLC